jgi:hypothetical protein
MTTSFSHIEVYMLSQFMTRLNTTALAREVSVAASDMRIAHLERMHRSKGRPIGSFFNFEEMCEYIEMNRDVSHPNLGICCRLWFTAPSIGISNSIPVYFTSVPALLPLAEDGPGYIFTAVVSYQTPDGAFLNYKEFDIRECNLVDYCKIGDGAFFPMETSHV